MDLARGSSTQASRANQRWLASHMRTIRVGEEDRRASELDAIGLDAGRNCPPRRGALDHHGSHQDTSRSCRLSLRAECRALVKLCARDRDHLRAMSAHTLVVTFFGQCLHRADEMRPKLPRRTDNVARELSCATAERLTRAMRRYSSPSISRMFCTAAPDAPLPRLSSRATSTA